MRVAWILFVVSVVATGEFAPPASAQGFLVQPMRMETFVKPGRTFQLPLEIHNLTPRDMRTVELSLAELSQTPDGHWQVVDPDRGQMAPHAASAFNWVRLLEEVVDVPVGSVLQTSIEVRVPQDARGTYFAALLAEPPRPQATGGGIVVRSRFLIPIILHIEGRPVRQRVELDDVSMTFGPSGGLADENTTAAKLHITNAGQTFPRVRGQILVDRLAGERWRTVTRVEVPERGIIPGVTLALGDDLRRRLPSGTYRLAGQLWVDGRRLGALEREIAFEGDPNIDALAYDTVLSLTPQIVEIPVVPGAARTMVLRVENPSEYPVNVQVAASTPRGLAGATLGETTGDEFSAETWTEVRPTEFTLGPFGSQNVRVIGSVPRENATQPNYYADIVLQGTYADGQSAGDTRSTIHLTNIGVESRAQGMIDQLQLAQGGEPSEYVVTARLLNTGNVDIRPTLAVQVFGNAAEPVTGANLAGEEGPLLPLTTRTFSEEVDLSSVDPGDYVVRATAHFGAGVATQQIHIAVIDEAIDGETSRSVIVTDGEISVDLPEPILAPGG